MRQEEFEVEVFGVKAIAKGYLHPPEGWSRGFFELEELWIGGQEVDLGFFTYKQVEIIENEVYNIVEEEMI